MTEKITVVRCPTCGQVVEWTAEQPFRPFCSARCKLIDLGTWAAQGYTIRTEAEEDQLSADDYPQSH